VKRNGIQCLLPGGIDGSTLLDHGGVATAVVHLGLGSLGYHRPKCAKEDYVGVLYPQAGCLGPLLDGLLLALVYLPVAWAASLAACSICTCLKACSRVACDDGRPNEDRTCRADSCML